MPLTASELAAVFGFGYGASGNSLFHRVKLPTPTNSIVAQLCHPFIPLFTKVNAVVAALAVFARLCVHSILGWCRKTEVLHAVVQHRAVDMVYSEAIRNTAVMVNPNEPMCSITFAQIFNITIARPRYATFGVALETICHRHRGVRISSSEQVPCFRLVNEVAAQGMLVHEPPVATQHYKSNKDIA